MTVQVIIYNTKNGKIHKLFARFKDKAYSGSLRAEGDLLVAGGENGLVQVISPVSETEWQHALWQEGICCWYCPRPVSDHGDAVK